LASRRKGRILAFQALYFWEASSSDKVRRTPTEELVNFAWLEEKKLDLLDENTACFSKTLIAGTIENIDEIDKKIKEHLENWDISRLSRVDLAVMRMSVYSLMFQNEIFPSIIIEEAIGICREFGADDSFRFVNGVLDSIRKNLNQNTRQEKDQAKKQKEKRNCQI
jgi:N utilization substance protein B